MVYLCFSGYAGTKLQQWRQCRKQPRLAQWFSFGQSWIEIIKTIKIYKTPPVLHQHDLFTFCSLVQFGVVGAFWYVEI